MNNQTILIVLIIVSLLLAGCQLIEYQSTPISNDEVRENDDHSKRPANSESHANSPTVETTHSIDYQKDALVDHTKYDRLPFDERLIAQGYSLISLPNDFPIRLPYHFILVGKSLTVDDLTKFTGTFCYDLPLSVDEVAQTVEHLNEFNFRHESSDDKMTDQSIFHGEIEAASFNGSLHYFSDDYENTCVILNIATDDDKFISIYNDLTVVDESLNYVVESRTRQLANQYEPNFWERLELATNTPDMGYDSDDVQSISEKIVTKQFEFNHLSNGAPKIFPYEWFLMDQADNSTEQNWRGTFCTDTSIVEAIAKHHNLLAGHQANIIHYSINGSPSMNQKSNVEFMFNDVYGRGSWHGKTIFFIDRLNAYPVHKCINVNIVFSPDIIVD